jgi:putative ABC transport system permease protein
MSAKDEIKEYLDHYNDGKAEDDQILYLDISDIITSTMGTIIDAITYILVAFAAISLLVSSIMIGIITYISVLERTKEIGVLRSLGARKKDIARVFNAETLLVGFTAGLIGVIVALLITIPVNAIVRNLVSEFERIAILRLDHAIFLVLISMSLTLISGLIPSAMASRKDPFIALRTE